MLPVAYTSAAEKYFKKIKDNQLKRLFIAAIIEIRNNPSIGSPKTGDLEGILVSTFIIAKLIMRSLIVFRMLMMAQ